MQHRVADALLGRRAARAALRARAPRRVESAGAPVELPRERQHDEGRPAERLQPDEHDALAQHGDSVVDAPGTPRG
eukprot:2471070-Prymnesium_polylepis.1